MVTEIFIPEIKPAKEGEKRIPNVGGHKSHQNTEFLFEWCSKN